MQRSLSSTRPRIKRLLKHFKLKERNKTVVTLAFIRLEDNFIYAQWEWTSFWNISSPFYVGQSTKKAVYAEPHRLAADIKMHMFACIRFCSIVNWQKVRAVLCVEARQASTKTELSLWSEGQSCPLAITGTLLRLCAVWQKAKVLWQIQSTAAFWASV